MASQQDGKSLRSFGIGLVGSIPWGTHLCQFYESKQDLIDILVPYFAEGLRSNEFCMWITSPPLEVAEAKEAMREAVPDLDAYIQKGQMEIVSYGDWYLLGGKFDSNRVLQGWVQKENNALKRGFDGLRLSGNTFWVERSLWQSFVDYEEAVNLVIGQHKMLALCTYCLPTCSGTDVMDVVRNHAGTLVKQADRWYLVEDAARRMAANGALKASERMYSALFKNMTDGFAYHKLLVDDGGRPVDYVFLEVNPAFERATGLKPADVVGKRVTEVIPGIEKDPANWIGVYGKVALTGEQARFENYSEQLCRWYQVSAYSPEKGYFVAVFEDITERKKAERELWQAKNDWERTFDSVPDFIAILDRQHRIVRVNQAMAKALGVTQEQAIGLKCYACVHGSSVPPEFCPHAQTMMDGKEHVAEVHEPRLGGDFLVSTTPLNDEDGHMVGSVHVARNITERKQMQNKLEEYAAHLEELVEERTQQLKDSERLSAIGETAGMVGHDLRNPLQTITGETFLARDEVKNLPDCEAKDNLEESIGIISEQINYMNKIVSDLQDFVRPITPEKKAIDLKKLLNGTLSEVSMPDNIEVQTAFAEDLPQVYVDGQLLKRVFFNLFTNAVQAMPDGGKLTVKAQRGAGAQQGRVVTSIEDTGVGIPDSVRSKIFRPLFTTKSRGQGFGLAVCKRVIEAHGGTITFRSREGKGTEFTVELPL
ncbi:MAG: MEDS domain-containing protein [Candidatus Bathyarchaeia archaeon]